MSLVNGTVREGNGAGCPVAMEERPDNPITTIVAAVTDTAIRGAKPREKPYKLGDSLGLYRTAGAGGVSSTATGERSGF